MNGSLRIGSLFGIPFYVNVSWFLVLALVTWDYGSSLGITFPQLGGGAWLLGLITALLLFASVVAHELGHSLVALRQGIPVNSITLFLFGGLASLQEESKTPGDAFWVAIAGPAVSLILFVVFMAVQLLAPITGPLAAIVNLLAFINLALALFNLLPGLPLDGGNVLKAIVWKVTGKPYRGVAFASKVGQFLGWAGIGLGLLSILGLSNIGSIWTALVGWFLLQNATRYDQMAQVQEQLSGLTAADAVYPNSPIVSANLSLREFANQYIIGNPANWRKYLVVDEGGQLLGEIQVSTLKTVPTNDWWNISVRQLTQPIENLETVDSEEPLLEVVTRLEQRQATSELLVLKDSRIPIGLLEKASIIKLLQQRAETSAA